MRELLTAAGIALCQTIVTPCTGPNGLAGTIRRIVPTAEPDWPKRYDFIQHCLDGRECVFVAYPPRTRRFRTAIDIPRIGPTTILGVAAARCEPSGAMVR
jgi:hypothetical protein